jgi:hypothetical protein
MPGSSRGCHLYPILGIHFASRRGYGDLASPREGDRHLAETPQDPRTARNASCLTSGEFKPPLLSPHRTTSSASPMPPDSPPPGASVSPAARGSHRAHGSRVTRPCPVRTWRVLLIRRYRTSGTRDRGGSSHRIPDSGDSHTTHKPIHWKLGRVELGRCLRRWP